MVIIAPVFWLRSSTAVRWWIVYQAVQRFSHPVVVHTGLMMGVAAAGVALNGSITWLLFRSRQDLNIRSALIHEVGDTLSTAAIILGGWTISVTGHQWIDPALSILISALIIWSSVSIIGESLNILLEGTPRGMRLEELAAAAVAAEPDDRECLAGLARLVDQVEALANKSGVPESATEGTRDLVCVARDLLGRPEAEGLSRLGEAVDNLQKEIEEDTGIRFGIVEPQQFAKMPSVSRRLTKPNRNVMLTFSFGKKCDLKMPCAQLPFS